MSSSSSVGSGPQRRCEAWSFAMWPPSHPRHAPLLNEGAKRGASQYAPLRFPRSPTGLLNEGAKRGASQCHGVVPLAGAGQSSTKVRSVELRNLRMFHLPTMCDIPQRRCEAWSFAISPTGSGVISGLNPQRRCEAWSFAMSSRR